MTKAVGSSAVPTNMKRARASSRPPMRPLAVLAVMLPPYIQKDRLTVGMLVKGSKTKKWHQNTASLSAKQTNIAATADQPMSPKAATLVSVSNCSPIHCVALKNPLPTTKKKWKKNVTKDLIVWRKREKKDAAYVGVFGGISRRFRRQDGKLNVSSVTFQDDSQHQNISRSEATQDGAFHHQRSSLPPLTTKVSVSLRIIVCMHQQRVRL